MIEDTTLKDHAARDEGCEEFPYLTYAQRRIGQYYAIIEGRA